MACAGLLNTLMEPAMATNEMEKLNKIFNNFFIMLLLLRVNSLRNVARLLTSNDCLHLLRMNRFSDE